MNLRGKRNSNYIGREFYKAEDIDYISIVKLAMAVIQCASMDIHTNPMKFKREGTSHRRTAIEWVNSKENYPFSLVWISRYILNIIPDNLRYVILTDKKLVNKIGGIKLASKKASYIYGVKNSMGYDSE